LLKKRLGQIVEKIMNKMFLGSLVALALALAPNAMATTPAQSEPPPEVTQFKFFQYPANVPEAIISFLGTHTLPNGGKCAAGLTPTVAAPKDAWRGLKGNPPEAMRRQMSFDADRCRKVAPDNWDGSCGYLPDGVVAAGVMLCLSNDLVLATNGQISTLQVQISGLNGRLTIVEGKVERAQGTADQASRDAKEAKDGVDGLNSRQTATETTVAGHGKDIAELKAQRSLPIFTLRLGGVLGATGHFAQALGLTEFAFHTNSGGEAVVDVMGGLALGYDGRPGFAASLFAGYLFQVSKNWKLGPGGMINANLGATALQYRNLDAGLAAQAQYAVTDRLRLAIGAHFDPVARQAAALSSWAPSGGLWVGILGGVAQR
jgi:hypothetical protein